MQITSINKLTKENVIFHKAVINQYGNKSIKIEVKTPGQNRGRGPLVIESPLLFCFGVQKSVDEDGDIYGYSIPTCLWSDYKEPSQKELDFYNGLKKFEKLCYEHLKNVFGSETAKMLKIPLIEKDERPPILYSKLIFSKKVHKIHTLFHSRGNDKENPLDYLDQYCKVKMSLMIESIYISDETVTVQIKVNDIFVKPLIERQVLVTISPSDDEEED